ncbi:AraC family transcriptional regulator [Anaerosporomusa subterranea]|jgi:AraC family transcriptional regulator|uniref:AraC family transcriptional regulator n=1 Tax=Anaerosporomusa subterranea TaxID=1794912 RepID=A0A154BNG9_ANASB|nr:helix-turn-helix domain-containing protein [Anaerosporomusa subterranea]KYZ75537.1 AraC family transcriptional regulator [Anaerosporomusa subterranea]
MINIKETIARCVTFTEANLANKISLDDVALHCGISKYHLHRLFKSLTGESLMEYVQSRRLSASINDLIHTKMRIIDIALNYGFDYEQSYIRAFRKKFGYTPQKVRSQQMSLRITERINLNDIYAVNNSAIYKPFFVFRQRSFLVGMRYKILSKSGDKTANYYGRDFFYHHRQQVKNVINPEVYYGYTDWSGSNEGFIYYMPSVQVEDLSQIPDGMHGVEIPAHKYVVFRFVGFFRPDEINGRQVGRLLVHMYSKWIFSSGFTFADRFRFEYIDNRLTKDNYCELDIYQPIADA